MGKHRSGRGKGGAGRNVEKAGRFPPRHRTDGVSRQAHQNPVAGPSNKGRGRIDSNRGRPHDGPSPGMRFHVGRAFSLPRGHILDPVGQRSNSGDSEEIQIVDEIKPVPEKQKSIFTTEVLEQLVEGLSEMSGELNSLPPIKTGYECRLPLSSCLIKNRSKRVAEISWDQTASKSLDLTEKQEPENNQVLPGMTALYEADPSQHLEAWQEVRKTCREAEALAAEGLRGLGCSKCSAYSCCSQTCQQFAQPRQISLWAPPQFVSIWEDFKKMPYRSVETEVLYIHYRLLRITYTRNVPESEDQLAIRPDRGLLAIPIEDSRRALDQIQTEFTLIIGSPQEEVEERMQDIRRGLLRTYTLLVSLMSLLGGTQIITQRLVRSALGLCNQQYTLQPALLLSIKVTSELHTVGSVMIENKLANGEDLSLYSTFGEPDQVRIHLDTSPIIQRLKEQLNSTVLQPRITMLRPTAHLLTHSALIRANAVDNVEKAAAHLNELSAAAGRVQQEEKVLQERKRLHSLNETSSKAWPAKRIKLEGEKSPSALHTFHQIETVGKLSPSEVQYTRAYNRFRNLKTDDIEKIARIDGPLDLDLEYVNPLHHLAMGINEAVTMPTVGEPACYCTATAALDGKRYIIGLRIADELRQCRGCRMWKPRRGFRRGSLLPDGSGICEGCVDYNDTQRYLFSFPGNSTWIWRLGKEEESIGAAAAEVTEERRGSVQDVPTVDDYLPDVRQSSSQVHVDYIDEKPEIGEIDVNEDWAKE